MKSTAETIKDMEKEFDEKFPYEADKMGEDGSPFKIVDSLYRREKFKSFLNSYTRTLLESFGEEIVAIAKKHNDIANDEIKHKWCDHCSCLVTVLHEQRLKMKEILEVIK